MSTKIHVSKPTLPPLEKYVDQLSKIWESGILTNSGFYANKLESDLKKYLSIPNISLVDNGTTALLIAIKALRLSGSVITTPFTFPATVSAIEWCGLTPILCDIDLNTGNIDVNKIEKLIRNDTSAILPVHVFGVPCELNVIDTIANKYGLKVIYDAAHTFGIEVGGKSLSMFGDISTLSFHATKLFYTAEGGALVYKDNSIYERIRLLRNFGIQYPDDIVLSGINGKMSELHAALGELVLKTIDIEIEKRRILYEIYIENLSDFSLIEIPKIPKSVSKWNYQYFFVRSKYREQIIDVLEKENIIARKYFYPICCGHFGFSDYVDNARYLSHISMVLPLHGSLTEETIIKICNTIKSVK